MRSKKYSKVVTEMRDITDPQEIGGIGTSPKKQDKTEKKESLVVEWAKEIIIVVVVAGIIMQFVKPTIVQQRSMEPNFYTNDYLLVSRQSYKLFRQAPQRGEVIIFESEMKTDEGSDKLLIKRVIGVPGDVITISDGKVYVNGEMLDDSYTKDQYTSGDIVDLVVPDRKVFCLGDNRAVSVDSRSEEIGLIDYDDIVGKAVFKILPFSNFGRIRNPYQ